MTNRRGLLVSLGALCATAASPAFANRMRLRGQVAVAAPAIVEVMGGLSRSGGGAGFPVTASSVVGGDPLGHWMVSGGLCCPSSTGDAANLNAGPYSLLLDNGQLALVAIEPAAWDVTTQAEWTAVIGQTPATLAGKSIAVRPLPGDAIYTSGVTGQSGTPMRRANMGGLKVKARNPSHRPIFDQFYLRGTLNVSFDGIDTPETAVTKFRIYGEELFPVGNITIENCRLTGAPQDPYREAPYAAGEYPNPHMVSSEGSFAGSVGALTIRNNEIKWCSRGINVACNSGQLITSGNDISYFFDDGINVAYGYADVPWYCDDNCFRFPLGRGQVDVDKPHVDAIRGIGSTTATTDWHVYIRRNRILHGGTRGGMQGILLSDFRAKVGDGPVDSGCFFIPEVVGNVFANQHTVSLAIENVKDGLIAFNTVVGRFSSGQSLTVALKIGSGSEHATHAGSTRVENNVSEDFYLSPTCVPARNVAIGRNGSTIPYVDAFTGPIFDPVNVEQLMARYAAKPGGPLAEAGAIGTGAVIWPSKVPGNDGVSLLPV